MNIIKLVSPWYFRNNQPERYYIIAYYNGMHWLMIEAGWEGPDKPPEVRRFVYRAGCRQPIKVVYKPWGIRVSFGDYETYIDYCGTLPLDEEGYPFPSWAVACELLTEEYLT